MTTNTRIILALAISTSFIMTVVNEKRETPMPALDKADKFLSTYLMIYVIN